MPIITRWLWLLGRPERRPPLPRPAPTLRDAVLDVIHWHNDEARACRSAAAELDPGDDDEGWQYCHDAALHEAAAARLLDALSPKMPPYSGIRF